MKKTTTAAATRTQVNVQKTLLENLKTVIRTSVKECKECGMKDECKECGMEDECPLAGRDESIALSEFMKESHYGRSAFEVTADLSVEMIIPELSPEPEEYKLRVTGTVNEYIPARGMSGAWEDSSPPEGGDVEEILSVEVVGDNNNVLLTLPESMWPEWRKLAERLEDEAANWQGNDVDDNDDRELDESRRHYNKGFHDLFHTEPGEEEAWEAEKEWRRNEPPRKLTDQEKKEDETDARADRIANAKQYMNSTEESIVEEAKSNNWIQKAVHPSRKGEFTAKAKKAGKSVAAYASGVLANPKDHDKKTVGQARFAKNVSKISKGKK